MTAVDAIMIRRPTTIPSNIHDAGRDAWVLIPQVEHAQLAAALAEHWGVRPFQPLPRKALLRAIHHHDDGWAAWDARPEVDEQGRPVDFTEMRLGDALAIWRESIAAARRLDDLAAYAVSGHFCALLAASDTRRRDAEAARLADAFFEEQRRIPVVRHGKRAVRYLQFFDRLSLWLSCSPRSESWQTESPSGAVLEFRPGSEDRIVVAPWPWRVESKTVVVDGRRVAADNYESAEALAKAASTSVRLEWTLVPSP